MDDVIYQAGTETIRQMPQNYCLAVKRMGVWVLFFDIACSKIIAHRILDLLFESDICYGTGENLIAEYEKRYK